EHPVGCRARTTVARAADLRQPYAHPRRGRGVPRGVGLRRHHDADHPEPRRCLARAPAAPLPVEGEPARRRGAAPRDQPVRRGGARPRGPARRRRRPGHAPRPRRRGHVVDLPAGVLLGLGRAVDRRAHGPGAGRGPAARRAAPGRGDPPDRRRLLRGLRQPAAGRAGARDAADQHARRRPDLRVRPARPVHRPAPRAVEAARAGTPHARRRL
ncbi:MAG: Transcriptional regulator, AcrR family, partial [uncultured Actinomycetospora sp.]